MTSRTQAASRQLRCRVTPIATAVGIALLSLSNAYAQTEATPAPSADQPVQPAAQSPAGSALPTPAQQNAASPAATVKVTGFRYAIEKSLDQKRDANCSDCSK